jgi:plasmid stability protein
MHNEYMNRDSAITIRVPTEFKKKLERRAKEERRSLTAQIEHDLSMVLASEEVAPQRAVAVKLLGRFPGPVPTEDEFKQARDRLWHRLRVGTVDG